MTTLRFNGLVEAGDKYRCHSDEDHGAIFIGDHDVVAAIYAADFSGPVTIAIADKRFTGESLISDVGWGYSDYTPVDADVLLLGEHNLLDILNRHVEQFITMWVSDEPVDLGEDGP